MNVHPILVHFPIALLTIAALMEILSFSWFTKRAYWWMVKGAFVTIGAVSSVFAFLSGDAIEDSFRSSRQLVEVHSSFAFGTVLVFGIIALSYVLVFLKKEGFANWTVIRMAERVQQPMILIPLSIIGLVLVTVTGALGGAIVYGPDIDPIVSIVYHALIK